ncbi:ABC transporter G family member 20-like [Oppia nitens]|uniref:ABC transporter G family member 20-like n=1 Tax=Oppia nitens TaxID=1686743 RepID=UPI0023DC120D|nr:ABC transporter G family member 20-like [Oppia nitens]
MTNLNNCDFGYQNNGYIPDGNEITVFSDSSDDLKEKSNTQELQSKDINKNFERKKSVVKGLNQLREEIIISDTRCLNRLIALTLKNFKQMSRNPILLLFYILMPAIEISLLIECVGKDIKQIPVSIYNPDTSGNFSKMFINSIDENQIHLVHYKSLDDAMNAVRVNDVWAVLYFDPQFSQHLISRFYTSDMNEESVNSSTIQLRIDMSNQVIGSQLSRYIAEAYERFVNNIAIGLKTNLTTIKPIVNNGLPIYGQKNGLFSSFVAPGALIVVAFFATTTITCHLLIKEINDGLVDRNLVAGVRPLEFVMSHIILQLFMLTLQIGLKVTLAFVAFGIPHTGSIVMATGLTFLQGTCGLMFGLMISAICPDEMYATTLCIGAFFPTVIIGGIFWPIESMVPALKYISKVLPCTLAIQSLRSILLRGWGLNELQVYTGFIVTLLWLLFFTITALTFFIRKL